MTDPTSRQIAARIRTPSEQGHTCPIPPIVPIRSNLAPQHSLSRLPRSQVPRLLIDRERVVYPKPRPLDRPDVGAVKRVQTSLKLEIKAKGQEL